jgi:putative phosphoesterase
VASWCRKAQDACFLESISPSVYRMNIGVISDTHGLLRPEALKALRGSDHIIHAGDIGSKDVLDALEAVAPVSSIRGNVDIEPWSQHLPITNVVELESAGFYVLHDLNELDLDPVAAGFAAVISGHSHVPKIEWRNGVLYLNPGSAGPRRFKLPISVGRVRLENGLLQPELIPLG